MLLWHNANFTCNEIELTDVEKVQSDKILNVICKKLVEIRFFLKYMDRSIIIEL